MKIRNWITVLALAGLVACGGDEAEQSERIRLDQPDQSSQQTRASWPEGLAEWVDSANTAISEGRYEDAAVMYREMTTEHPDMGTLWFGLYLTEDALGNEEAAEAALERVEVLAPGLSRMHEAAEGSGMGDAMGGRLPADHPPLDSAEGGDAPPPNGG